MPIFDIIHNLSLSLPKPLFFHTFLLEQQMEKSLIFFTGGMTKIGRKRAREERYGLFMNKNEQHIVYL